VVVVLFVDANAEAFGEQGSRQWQACVVCFSVPMNFTMENCPFSAEPVMLFESLLIAIEIQTLLNTLYSICSEPDLENISYMKIKAMEHVPNEHHRRRYPLILTLSKPEKGLLIAFTLAKFGFVYDTATNKYFDMVQNTSTLYSSYSQWEFHFN
jgi:hypothetical protein